MYTAKDIDVVIVYFANHTDKITSSLKFALIIESTLLGGGLFSLYCEN